MIFAAGALMLLAGCAEEPAYVSPGEQVISQPPPPPPAEAVIPAPAPGYVWISGYWSWQGRWVWVPGAWAVRPHPHAYWVPGHWVHRGHGYIWIGGHWR